MSIAPVQFVWSARDTASPVLKTVRETLGRAFIPGYRWRDPLTGRFVRREKESGYALDRHETMVAPGLSR